MPMCREENAYEKDKETMIVTKLVFSILARCCTPVVPTELLTRSNEVSVYVGRTR